MNSFGINLFRTKGFPDGRQKYGTLTFLREYGAAVIYGNTRCHLRRNCEAYYQRRTGGATREHDRKRTQPTPHITSAEDGSVSVSNYIQCYSMIFEENAKDW